MRPTRSRKSVTIKSVLLVVGICAIVLASLGAFYWYRFASIPPGPFRFVSTVAGANGEFGEPFGIAIKSNSVYVSDGLSGKVLILDKNGKVVSEIVGLDTPSGISDGKAGLVVVDSARSAVYRLDATPMLIAGVPGQTGSTDGDAAVATFNGPIGAAVDKSGKIFIADTYNDRIRTIENGKVATLAGSSIGFADGDGSAVKFNTPTGVAVWNDKLLVADTGNHRIRVVETDGRVWTLAGNNQGHLQDGPLAEASFVQPTAFAVANDKIYVADGNAIRRIDTGENASITTISGQWRGLVDGEAETARFNRPSGLAIDANGDLLVADSENRLIRRFSSSEKGPAITPDQIAALRDKPDEFRQAAPARWPFDPPDARRDIAGTLGELRGDMAEGNEEPKWFHNGLDIAGVYGETVRFIRDEKVLRPFAVENFDTLRELIRMPTLGYIHVRLGRNAESVPLVARGFSSQLTTQAN